MWSALECAYAGLLVLCTWEAQRAGAVLGAKRRLVATLGALLLLQPASDRHALFSDRSTFLVGTWSFLHAMTGVARIASSREASPLSHWPVVLLPPCGAGGLATAARGVVRMSGRGPEVGADPREVAAVGVTSRGPCPRGWDAAAP